MKRYITITLTLICVFLLAACGNQTNMGQKNDRIEVYDKNQNMILEIDSQKELDYFSNLIGNTTANMENENFLLVKLPKDAIVSYEYKFITNREDGKETEAKFYVYENYQYITLMGIPMVSPLTWKISDEEYAKLNNPEN